MQCGGYKTECGVRYSELLAITIVLAAFWTKIVPSKPNFWPQAGALGDCGGYTLAAI